MNQPLADTLNKFAVCDFKNWEIGVWVDTTSCSSEARFPKGFGETAQEKDILRIFEMQAFPLPAKMVSHIDPTKLEQEIEVNGQGVSFSVIPEFQTSSLSRKEN